MARPASRGLQSFQGGPVKPMMMAGLGGGADTKTGMTSGVQPMMMGTRAAASGTRSGNRPTSALKRVPTAGLKPGANEPPAGMIGLTTDVKVESRPLTSGGLTGMGGGLRTAGPGRQLADISYYRSELRNKLAEITREIESMNAELAKYSKDNQNYTLYERKYDTVVKEVRALEGQLADFNLALDKHRTNTDLNEIKHMFTQLKAKNDSDRKQIDEIFMKSAQYEKQAKSSEEEIVRIVAAAEERMRAAGEDFRMEYTELQDESADLQLRIGAKEQRLQDIEQKIAQTQQQLKSAKYQIHARGMELMARRTELQRKHSELEDDTNTALTPTQLKEKLLLKVKEANALMAQSEQRRKALEEAIDSLQEQTKKKEEEVMNWKSYAQKAKKWEQLMAQEKQFQAMIDQYPEQKQTEVENKARLQEMIVALLKHSAKAVVLQQNVPTADAFSEVKNELNFKEARLKNAKETRDALEKERERRKNELHRVEGLDKKISLELQSLKEKVSAMTAEMSSFKSTEQLTKESEEAKRVLLVTKQKLIKQREAIKQQVAQLSAQHKKRDVELTASDVYKKIQTLEKTLSAYSQNNFQMSEFISQRKRESEYESLQKESAALTSEINAALIAQLKS